jgi:hypothetical protein
MEQGGRSHTWRGRADCDLCSTARYAEEDSISVEMDYRVELEAFWRSHHEAWRRSDLNQREYCESHGLPLKRFGNWRAKFKQEPEVPEKLLRTDAVVECKSYD